MAQAHSISAESYEPYSEKNDTPIPTSENGTSSPTPTPHAFRPATPTPELQEAFFSKTPPVAVPTPLAPVEQRARAKATMEVVLPEMIDVTRTDGEDSLIGLFLPTSVRRSSVILDNSIIEFARFVDINFELLDKIKTSQRSNNIDYTFYLNLFDDIKFLTTLDDMEIISPSTIVWSGYIPDEKDSYVTLVLHNGVIAGSIMLPTARYQVHYAGQDSYIIFKVNPDFFLPDKEVVLESVNVYDELPTQFNAPTSMNSMPVIDIMVLYTTEARQSVQGQDAIEALIHLGVFHLIWR